MTSDLPLQAQFSKIDAKNFEKSGAVVSQSIIDRMKTVYDRELGRMRLSEDDLHFFSWASQPLKLYLVQLRSINSDDTIYVSFACKSSLPLIEPSTVVFKSIVVSEDDDYFLFSQANQNQQINFGIKALEIPEALIIPESTNYSMSGSLTEFSDWPFRWTKAEYVHATKNISSTGFQLEEMTLRFNQSGLHANKYAFNEMLEAIPNKQFHQEVKECIAAYETPLFYVCAAGLGGVIESLLSMTIGNYQVRKRDLPKDPTAYDYLNVLSGNSIISDRDLKYLQSTFMLRNAVSHYNSGAVTNELCDRMMSSIQMVFKSIYLTSQEWRRKFNPPSNLTFKQWKEKFPDEAQQWLEDHSSGLR